MKTISIVFVTDVQYKIIMTNITNFEIGNKVRWYYKDGEFDTKPTDEIVYIGSELIDIHVRIDRKTRDGKIKEGGYVRIEELYELNEK